MASITKYRTGTKNTPDSKRRTRWRVQYRDERGIPRTKRGFATKADAELWEAQNLIDQHTGKWIDPQLQRITIEQLIPQWELLESALAPSSRRVHKSALETHVLPRWRNVQIRNITNAAIQEWILTVGGVTTMKRCQGVLVKLLDIAIRDGKLRNNPARNLRMPRKPSPKHAYMSIKQLQLVADCSSRPEMILLLGTVGLRWGEAAALRPMDVDFARNRIRVERNAVTVGSEVIIGTPKSGERREVSAPQKVMDLIKPFAEGIPSDGLLWPSPKTGEPLKLPTSGSFIEVALKKAREQDPTIPVGIKGAHSFRHVAAGILVHAGANVKVVQRQLGHTSAAMTLDTYSDLFDSDLDSIGMTLNQLLTNESEQDDQ